MQVRPRVEARIGGCGYAATRGRSAAGAGAGTAQVRRRGGMHGARGRTPTGRLDRDEDEGPLSQVLRGGTVHPGDRRQELTYSSHSTAPGSARPGTRVSGVKRRTSAAGRPTARSVLLTSPAADSPEEPYFPSLGPLVRTALPLPSSHPPPMRSESVPLRAASTSAAAQGPLPPRARPLVGRGPRSRRPPSPHSLPLSSTGAPPYPPRRLPQSAVAVSRAASPRSRTDWAGCAASGRSSNSGPSSTRGAKVRGWMEQVEGAERDRRRE